jgi:hypothetical protein
MDSKEHAQPEELPSVGRGEGAPTSPPDAGDEIPPKAKLQAIVPIAMLIAVMLALPMGMVGWALRGWQEERRPAEVGDSQPDEPVDDALRSTLEAAVSLHWTGPTLDAEGGALDRLEIYLPAEQISGLRQDLLQFEERHPGGVVELTLAGVNEPAASFLLSGEAMRQFRRKYTKEEDNQELDDVQNSSNQMIIIDILEK